MADAKDMERTTYEQFVVLFTRHERDIRAFVRSLLPTWDDAHEVMQEVSLVAWRKFGELDHPEGFLQWLLVIARFEVLKHRRKHARDRLFFSEELLEQLATETMDERGRLAAERSALEGCLQKLEPVQRQLVLKAYTPGVTIKETAEIAGLPPMSLYKMLNKIRGLLLTCIQSAVLQERLA